METSLIREQIGGIAIRELVERYGSPTYVYDIDRMLGQVESLRSFDVIRYAMKACSNLAILDRMRSAKVVVDSVSAGELTRARAAGFDLSYDPDGDDAPQVVYTADVFDEDALEIIEAHGVHCNLGSPEMIEQLADRVGATDVTLRLNPGFGHGHSHKTNTGGPQSKHGIWHEQLPDVLERANRAGVTVSGLHMHIGSGTDFEHLAQVCGSMLEAAKRVGKSLRTISAGGGLPVPYQPGDSSIDVDRYHSLWADVQTGLSDQFGHTVRLEIEPGRYISAEAGYLLGEIRAIKAMGENCFYLLDVGFNALARPILYGAYHPMSICPANPRNNVAFQDVIVGGPLCESGDIFTQDDSGVVQKRELPVAEVGDTLVIECAGAYGSVMASNYNSKPLPAEIMIEEGESHLIRERQTLDDVMRNERIPARSNAAVKGSSI